MHQHSVNGPVRLFDRLSQRRRPQRPVIGVEERAVKPFPLKMRIERQCITVDVVLLEAQLVQRWRVEQHMRLPGYLRSWCRASQRRHGVFTSPRNFSSVGEPNHTSLNLSLRMLPQR